MKVSNLTKKLQEILGRVSGFKEKCEAEKKEIAEAEKIADDILEALGEASDHKE